MTGVCAWCEAKGDVQQHHLTGRVSPHGAYFDQTLVVPLCISCHTGQGGVHASLRAVGCESPANGAGDIAHRLQRFALYAKLLADSKYSLTLSPPATEALYLLLVEAVSALESHLDAA